MVGVVVGVATVLGVASLLLLLIKKMMKLRVEVDAARAEFLQRTGYQYVSALTLKANPTRQKETRNGVFTHYFEIYSEAGKRITAQSWLLATRQPPRVNFQVVDRKLIGAMRAFLNVVAPTKRTGASRTDVSPAPAIRAAANVHQAVEYVLNRGIGA